MVDGDPATNGGGNLEGIIHLGDRIEILDSLAISNM